MLKFDFSNLMADSVGQSDGLTANDISALAESAKGAHQKFNGWRESREAIFFDVVNDPDLTRGIADKASEIASRFENLVVLGIGGSALGLRCLAQALLPAQWNLRTSEARGRKPRIFVCDNIDPDAFSGLLDTIGAERTCFMVISKSGGTTETAAQYLVARGRLKAALGDRWKKNVIAVTDPARGVLREIVQKEGLDSFPVPPMLGGRFSVLCSVGLLPAACLGIDIEAMLQGARDMAKRCSAATLDENPAYRIGGFQHWFDAKKRKNISVMIPYSDSLMLASDWYAQLWAESLGKEGKGSTPVKALGATDQHSQVQLYMEGPRDKVFTFLGVERFRADDSATRISDAEGAYAYLNGKDMGEILRAEQQATTKALASQGRPSMTVSFPAVDARHMGEFFMAYETATAFAGALYGVNPFDQPGVELGKKLTREMLAKA
ncbi:MAG: glucose-6-phosphate isomerase [Proteobacteria bacterium]|nr:glucose-6-phosphate isomerase [Pseudomonadota bacterium]